MSIPWLVVHLAFIYGQKGVVLFLLRLLRTTFKRLMSHHSAPKMASLTNIFVMRSLKASSTCRSFRLITPSLWNVQRIRWMSDGKGSDDDNSPNTTVDRTRTKDVEDPFGLDFKDSTDEQSGNLGPKDDFPPNYIRDTATGKFTGKVQSELSSKDATLLQLDALGLDKLLSERLQQALSLKKDALGTNQHLEDLARRIREEESTLNPLGRSVSDLISVSEKDDRVSREKDGSILSAPLSSDEYSSLVAFMKASDDPSPIAKKIIEEADTLIPHVARKSTTKVPSSSKVDSDFNPDLDLEWMTLAAQRAMSDSDPHDMESPFASLMPSDLNPAKKVNRKKAKAIPTSLLHHNNLQLLRRYMTPGGQIMNRVQSRLGAKDQRKIAKLVKRARHLGLIPYIGQWKVEDHGNIKEKDILEERDWEKKLMERGFVERKSNIWKMNPTGDHR
jgi:ribosomal protein S18